MVVMRGIVLVAIALVAIIVGIMGELACGPSAPAAGSGATDGGVDRIILMASTGGASCSGFPGPGGATVSPAGAGPMDAGGGAGGAAAVGSGGGHGGAPGAATGGHGAPGGAAGVVGHGGGTLPGSAGTGGAATGGVAAGGRAGGTAGGGGGLASPGGAAGAPATGGVGGGAAAAGAGGLPGSGGAGAAGGEIGGAGSGGAGVVTPPPAPGELAIVELLINPAGTDTGREWIEVVNHATHSLDLVGLHIADAANDAPIEFMASGTTILLPEARAVLIQSADATKNGGVTLGISSGIFGGSFGTRVSLNNDADTVRICSGPCGGGVIIDQFTWDASLGVDYDAHALSIDDGGRRCPAPTPFGDAGSFGTPGTENPPCP